MKTHNEIFQWLKAIKNERRNILNDNQFLPAERKTSDNRENLRDYEIKKDFHLLNSFN